MTLYISAALPIFFSLYSARKIPRRFFCFHYIKPLEKFRAGGHFRIVVVDAEGRRAWSNPVWLDAL